MVMSTERLKLAEIVKRLIDARLVDVHTSMPGRVTEYDKTTRMASVQPLLRGVVRREQGPSLETMPIITRVPVMFQGTSRNGVTFPIEAGDLVWLMFSEQAIDRLLVSDGNIQDPKSPVRFSINGAVCIPGFNTSTTPSDQVDDDALVVHGDEIKLGSKDATERVLYGDLFLDDLMQLLYTIAGQIGLITATAGLATVAAPQATAITNAINSFVTGLSNYKSHTKVT